VAFVLVGVISSAFSAGPVDGLGPIRNPLGIEGFSYVYGSLTALLAAEYFGGVTATQTIFQALTPQSSSPN